MAPDNHRDRLRENPFVPERGKLFKETSASESGWVGYLDKRKRSGEGKHRDTTNMDRLGSLMFKSYCGCMGQQFFPECLCLYNFLWV